MSEYQRRIERERANGGITSLQRRSIKRLAVRVSPHYELSIDEVYEILLAFSERGGWQAFVAMRERISEVWELISEAQIRRNHAMVLFFSH
jgi:hypothetical protein